MNEREAIILGLLLGVEENLRKARGYAPEGEYLKESLSKSLERVSGTIEMLNTKGDEQCVL